MPLPHRSWSGTTAARCQSCGELFSTVSNFDKHKPGPLRSGVPTCGDPAALTRRRSDGTTEPVFSASQRASGVVWIGYSRDTRFDAEAAS